LLNTLKLAQQQAILETSTLGLRIDNNSYQILKLHNLSTWEPLSNKGIFKITYFPKNTVMTLKTSNKTLQGSPAIIINSTGDMTPFTLGLGTNEETVITLLTGHRNGSFNLSTAKTK